MWNKKRRKRAKPQPQIYIPKCCQQPRSRGSKPRTDFSLFICSSSSSSSYSPSSILLRRHRGSMLEFSRYRDGLSIITAASINQGCEGIISIGKKEMPGFPLAQCSTSQNGKHDKNLSDSRGVPFPETESVLSQNTLLGTSDNGTANDTSGQLAYPPDKSTSQVIESGDVYPNPGSVVWAKTAHQMWWPAKALDREEDLSSCKQLDEKPEELKSSTQHEEACDEWIESSSSRTEDSLERGRGKRKRKPKIHFDEVTFPIKSIKKVRRFRIMRYLGLTAPAGSPFSPTTRSAE